MLQVLDLTKSYGRQVLFARASFTVARGERVGLVGRNGHGKSTLLRILVGEEASDSGEVRVPRGYRVGHLTQHIRFTRPTVLEEGCLGLRSEERDEHYRVERILSGLGFSADDMDRPPERLSGGYHLRLNLAKLLVSDPDLLLLDEPTNYLDIVSVRWLKRFLRSWPKELLLVTHDRDFMDSVITHTLGIHRQSLRKIEGGTGKLYDQLEREEDVHEKTRQNVEKKRQEMESFITRFRAKARKASVVQSRIKALEKLPRLERLARIHSLSFAFNEAEFPAKVFGGVTDITFSYPPGPGEPAGPPIIAGFSLAIGRSDRIAVIGKNGRGKSTLLKLLAGDLTPQRGSLRYHDQTAPGIFGQTHVERLHPEATVEEEIAMANPMLGKTEVRSLCGTMMFEGDDALKKVTVLSGGERSRVLLGKILATPTNLLLLDEPTSHLDLPSVEALEASLDTYEGALVLVTHDERLLRNLANRLVVFRDIGLTVFEGTYDEFLEKVGWEDESSPADGPSRPAVVPLPEPASPPPPAGGTRRDLRKRRSEIVQERSRALAPLKARLETLEVEIMDLEGRLAAAHDELIGASSRGEGETIVRLSREVRELQDRIDASYAELTALSESHDREASRYDGLLAGL